MGYYSFSSILLALFLCISVRIGNFIKVSGNFDVIVLSMGGVGCTSMIGTLNKAQKDNAPFFVNSQFNNDRVKHCFPTFFEKVIYGNAKLSRGVIYIMGNMTLAAKSLIRRHFAIAQSIILQGDKSYYQELVYTGVNTTTGSTTTIPLCRKKPKIEAQEDLIIKSDIPQTLLRIQYALAYAGKHQRDSIGLLKHFNAWLEFARSGKENLIFLNFEKWMNNPQDPSVAALNSFLNTTNFHPGLVKKRSRFGTDLIQVS